MARFLLQRPLRTRDDGRVTGLFPVDYAIHDFVRLADYSLRPK